MHTLSRAEISSKVTNHRRPGRPTLHPEWQKRIVWLKVGPVTPGTLHVVTFDTAFSYGERDRLCADEWCSIINEWRDVHSVCFRFIAAAADPEERIPRALRLARARGARTVVSMATSEAGFLDALLTAKPSAVAIPLHDVLPAAHGAIGSPLTWSESTALIAAARAARVEVEVETTVTSAATERLRELEQLLAELGVEHWRIDFSRVDTRETGFSALAEQLVGVACRGRLHLTLYDFPQVRHHVLQRLQHGRPLPDLRRLSLIDAAQRIRITAGGTIATDGPAAVPIGHVRRQPLTDTLAVA